MLAHDRPGIAGGPLDRQRNRLDVLALARCEAIRERPGTCRRRPRLRHPRLQLQHSAAGDMGQRKIGIGGERALQQRLRARPCRQQQIHRRDVILDRGSAGASDRQVKAVLRRHELSAKLGAAFLRRC